MDNIDGLLYGGNSYTFSMHKKEVLRRLRKQRKPVLEVESHFSMKKMTKIVTNDMVVSSEESEGET